MKCRFAHENAFYACNSYTAQDVFSPFAGVLTFIKPSCPDRTEKTEFAIPIRSIPIDILYESSYLLQRIYTTWIKKPTSSKAPCIS